VSESESESEFLIFLSFRQDPGPIPGMPALSDLTAATMACLSAIFLPKYPGSDQIQEKHGRCAIAICNFLKDRCVGNMHDHMPVSNLLLQSLLDASLLGGWLVCAMMHRQEETKRTEPTKPVFCRAEDAK
jgi:hypothetical protein